MWKKHHLIVFLFILNLFKFLQDALKGEGEAELKKRIKWTTPLLGLAYNFCFLKFFPSLTFEAVNALQTLFGAP